jgi:hypothetical protein
MRLFEVAGRFVDDLETILRNLIKGGNPKKASEPNEKDTQTISYPALSQLLNNLGYGNIAFEQFARIYDENPSIAALLATRPDEEFITLGTDNEKQSTGGTDIPTGPSVDQMASRGAAAHMKSLS